MAVRLRRMRACPESRPVGIEEVSLRHNFFPFLTRKRIERMVEKGFRPEFSGM